MLSVFHKRHAEDRVGAGPELKVIDDSGHTGSEATTDAVLEALARFGAHGR
jgi:hypothetical protein